MTFFDLFTSHVSISAYSGEKMIPLQGQPWRAGDIQVDLLPQNGALAIEVSAETTPLERIHLRWSVRVPAGLRYLGDAWERGYGDLEWHGQVPERVMPWYFLAYDGQRTHGYGVKTQPGALCFWRVDASGVSLWLDLRCGGMGVELGGRALKAAQVVTREGQPGETPFAAARAFCACLCDHPRLPSQPVYGSNNWYYAYGESTHAQILEDTRLLVDLAPSSQNRPFMVIDAGWQPLSGEHHLVDSIVGGPYTGGNPRFPDMPGLAEQMRFLGARPGIWLRPLAACPDDPASMLLPAERVVDASASARILDPSIPEVLERVAADVRCLREWGYELVKHDFSTVDLLGRWGFQMGTVLTNPGWRFADRTRTTAEVILAFYRAVRAGAGEGPDSSLVIGCNTIGHLGAGLFELQRTGDDTSGRVWERTRKYGVNTLAFRAPQHGTFFAADADCMGHAAAMPWEMNAQFLDLLARSGTPLFVSIDPAALGPDQRGALVRAYTAASQPQPLAEPLDWLETTCPSLWKVGGETVRYDWVGSQGIPPNPQSIPMWWS